MKNAKTYKMVVEPTIERADQCKERAKYHILHQEFEQWIEQDTEEKFARAIVEGRMPRNFIEEQADSALYGMYINDMLDGLYATGRVDRKLNDEGEFIYWIPEERGAV